MDEHQWFVAYWQFKQSAGGYLFLTIVQEENVITDCCLIACINHLPAGIYIQIIHYFYSLWGCINNRNDPASLRREICMQEV